METHWILVIALAAGALGALISWLWARQRHAAELAASQQERATLHERAAAELRGREAQARELGELRTEKDRLAGECASLRKALELQARAVEEKLALVKEAERGLRESFDALAAKALSANNESFLKLAETRLKETQGQSLGEFDVRKKEFEGLVKPLEETLKRLGEQTREVDERRAKSHGELAGQIQSLMGANQKLASETGNLAQALRAPQVRGKWGEIGLRNLVEMAGMQEYCDFHVQRQVFGEAGRQQPDMTVRLPGGRTIVIDAKVPLPDFVEGGLRDEAAREAWQDSTAAAIRTHLQALGQRAYWSQFKESPDFVILFLPTESLYYAALQRDPELLVAGVENRVAVLTPASLIPVLRAIAFGWRQERLSRNAEEVQELGKELYKRLSKFLEHFVRVRNSLDAAVRSYNDAVGSLEHKVLPQARRFRELGATSLPELSPTAQIDTGARALTAEELDLPTVELTPPAPAELKAETD